MPNAIFYLLKGDYTITPISGSDLELPILEFRSDLGETYPNLRESLALHPWHPNSTQPNNPKP